MRKAQLQYERLYIDAYMLNSVVIDLWRILSQCRIDTNSELRLKWTYHDRKGNWRSKSDSSEVRTNDADFKMHTI